MRIAVPSNQPGGLAAARSEHFGHCDLFTIIDLDDRKQVCDVSTIANGDHQAGGCLVPVQLLHKASVQAIIVGGMGARPLQGFAEVGITVHFADRSAMMTVAEVVAGFTGDNLPVMHPSQACKGAGSCHH